MPRYAEKGSETCPSAGQLRHTEECPTFRELAEAIGCGVAVMPSAKGFFPEQHKQIYWRLSRSVSSLGFGEVVDSPTCFGRGTDIHRLHYGGWTAQPAERR